MSVMQGNNNNSQTTLADIFLEVLEQKANDEKQKAHIRKVKTLMDVPNCSEFLSRCLINAMGYPTPIAANTVDKAIDCLTHFYEEDIEDNQDLTKGQKAIQKGVMHNFMNDYRRAVKTFIASKNLLT